MTAINFAFILIGQSVNYICRNDLVRMERELTFLVDLERGLTFLESLVRGLTFLEGM